MLTKNFSLYLALRYLKPKRTFVSIITLISILGVTLGIAILILVISVFTGFEIELRDKIIGFEPHVTTMMDGPMEDWVNISKKCESVAHVTGVAPFVQGPCMIKFQNESTVLKIHAIDPDLQKKVVDLDNPKVLVEGKYDLDGDKVLIGVELANALRIHVGDKLALYSPGNMKSIMSELDRIEKEGKDKTSVTTLKQMILPKELEVTGIFETGRYIYDSELVIVPLFIGQELFNLGGAVHGLAIKTDNPELASDVRQNVNDALKGMKCYSLSWMDMNKQFFGAVRTERSVMFYILIFIVIVAAFGIMNTLITVTVQKTREIGVMKALGASVFQIVQVFVVQGMVVGIVGNITGFLVGLAITYYRNAIQEFLRVWCNIDLFPKSIYQFSEIPAKIVPSDVAIICVSAFIICSLAALAPAWVAARLDPVKALRYE